MLWCFAQYALCTFKSSLSAALAYKKATFPLSIGSGNVVWKGDHAVIAFSRLADQYCTTMTRATSARPTTSVRVPGIIMPRPPATSRRRKYQGTFLYRWPLRAAAIPKIPNRALMQIWVTSHQPETFSNSRAGEYAKI